MTRLDRHIAIIRNKMAFQRFLQALAWACIALAALSGGVILTYKLFLVQLPHENRWLLGGLIAAAGAALAYAIIRRPTSHEAAIAIDERLALKEKFSTALYARGSSDPFAQAAVRDAEHTADNVSLHKRFPLAFPRAAYTAVIVAAFALALTLLPTIDLFGRQVEQQRQEAERKQVTEARQAIKQAIAQLNSIPKAAADEKFIKEAKQDLEVMLNKPITDPAKARRTAASALKGVEEAMRKKIEDSGKYAQAKEDERIAKSLTVPLEGKGPAIEAQKELKKGNFVAAADQLEKLAEEFDKMPAKDKDDAVKQLKKMADQLQQAANDPQVQKDVQKQLQQAGVSPQQMQQMVNNAQQAAQGNQQAAQQLQQQMQQAMQQAQANGQNPQAIQQAIQKMQAAANSQAQAQQLAQATQAMAQAMQQAQQAAQNGQANAQGQQQMAQAQAALKAQLQQMGATQADLKQMQAAQQAMADAAQAGMNDGKGGQGQNGKDGQGGKDGKGQGQGKGEWREGKNNQQGQNGAGGLGRGTGDRDKAEFAPGDVKGEIAPTQDIEEGKLLAIHYVKAGAPKGESKIDSSKLREAVEKEVTDEVEQEHIPQDARKVVKIYNNVEDK